jgi:hypothetical protein
MGGSFCCREEGIGGKLLDVYIVTKQLMSVKREGENRHIPPATDGVLMVAACKLGDV